jgi:hypothetical protein
MAPITWYAITQELKPDWRGPIELSEALRVVDEYASRLRPFYHTGEEALAETKFGFSRDTDDYIDICLYTLTDISLSVELPVPPAEGLLANRDLWFCWDHTVDSLESVKRHVTAYFTLTPEAFKTHLLQTRR